MAKFVMVKAFTIGTHVPARDWLLNVDHIVSVCESTYRDCQNNETPCVYVTTTMVRDLMVDHSMAEFSEIIGNPDARRLAKNIIANALSECCHCNLPEQHRDNARAILHRLEAEGIGVS